MRVYSVKIWSKYDEEYQIVSTHFSEEEAKIQAGLQLSSDKPAIESSELFVKELPAELKNVVSKLLEHTQNWYTNAIAENISNFTEEQLLKAFQPFA